MTGVRFLAAFLILPAAGIGWLSSRRFAWLPLAARIGIAAAAGAVAIGVWMTMLSWANVRWSPALLLLAPLAVSGGLLWRGRRSGSLRADRVDGDSESRSAATILPLSLTAAALGLLTYNAMTARATSSDLLLLWGTKGERFARFGGIDTLFLTTPAHLAMNIDYPPLWTCLYALATQLAGRFAWGAALATLPLFVLLSVMVFWSLARFRLDARTAAAFAALYVALFGFLLASNLTAGNADPALLFFETVALTLLLFVPDQPGSFALAGVALAGAALLKLEGIAFDGALIVSAALWLRPMSWGRLWRLALPPAVAVAGWLEFCRTHALFRILSPHRPLILTGERFAVVAGQMWLAAGLGSWYAPWLVVAALIVLRGTTKRAAFAIATAALVALFDASIYFTTEADPTLWISWAASRTLLTPLLALFLAGAAPPAGGGQVASESRT